MRIDLALLADEVVQAGLETDNALCFLAKESLFLRV